MIHNLSCGGFTFDANFDSGNLAKVEVVKFFCDGKEMAPIFLFFINFQIVWLHTHTKVGQILFIRGSYSVGGGDGGCCVYCCCVQGAREGKGKVINWGLLWLSWLKNTRSCVFSSCFFSVFSDNKKLGWRCFCGSVCVSEWVYLQSANNVSINAICEVAEMMMMNTKEIFNFNLKNRF